MRKHRQKKLEKDKTVPANRFPYSWVALAYAVLILTVSSIPDLSPPQLGFRFQDKLYHFLEYGLFSLLLFFALLNSPRHFLRKYILLVSMLIGTSFAVLDEVHQNLIPGRSADIIDFFADFLGFAIIQLILWFSYRKSFRYD